MRHILLALTALSAPSLAWAAPDCGDEILKTADVAMTIKTPEQIVAPDIAGISFQSNTQSEPGRTESKPTTLQTAQAAPIAVSPRAETPNTRPAVVQAYADILKRRISRGEADLNLFDYAGAHADGELAQITAYTDHLAAQNPDAMLEADQIAYWANLYNALTLKVVLENYPVSSIRKIKSGAFSIGPWKRDAITVNGDVISLDMIEHGILRKKYPNPAMVHYMVNCASIGCPNLPNKLWVGATLDADRDQAARDFINSPRGVVIKGSKLRVSSIYDWFKEDFGGSKAATLDHFRIYGGAELKAAIDAGAKISGNDYDWTLNE